MAKKKRLLITTELQWYEAKINEIILYVESFDLTKLEDRIAYKETKGGGVLPIVISKKEDQVKSIRDTMKDLLPMLDALDNLRNKYEETDEKTRGDQQISFIMKRNMKNNNN